MNDTTYTYTYNEADQLLKAGNTTYSYDNDGNLIKKIDSSGTTTYTYDFENRLVEITFPDRGTNTFGYCPFGKRVWKKNKSGTTTFYFYDTEDILAEYDSFGNLKARYTFGKGIDNPISLRIGTQSYFYHLDALGSVISLTDSNKTQIVSYSYDAFGFPHPSSLIPNPFLFTAREYEEEPCLYYYRARYYDPEVGRFITKDPSEKDHPYIYVENNPITMIDPYGLWCILIGEKTDRVFRPTEPPEWSSTGWVLKTIIKIEEPIWWSWCIWERYFMSKTRGVIITTKISTFLCCEEECEGITCYTKTSKSTTQKPFEWIIKLKSNQTTTDGPITGRGFANCVLNPPRW